MVSSMNEQFLFHRLYLALQGSISLVFNELIHWARKNLWGSKCAPVDFSRGVGDFNHGSRSAANLTD